MLAIELVRVLLGGAALFLGIFGTCLVFDPISERPTLEKGNCLLILAAIALIIMFNI